MAISSTSIFMFSIFVSLIFVVSNARTCSNYAFTSSRSFNSCIDLPYHRAHLHWTYFASTDEVSIAYRARPLAPRGWIAWGINPTQTGMVGSQALVAFQNSNGSMTAYPTSLLSYNPTMLPGALSFRVSSVSAEFRNNEMIIFAVLGPLVSGTKANHVWQAGHLVSNGVPQLHAISLPNLQSFGELDFLSG